MEQNIPSNKTAVIKNIYFYLVAFVALMMVVFSLADLINTALRTWVFTKADNFDYYAGPVPACDPTVAKTLDSSTPKISDAECAKVEATNKQRQKDSQEGQRQRDMVRDISMIVVGIPVFIFHWMTIRKKEQNG
ncbi:MAG: hypothetical protein HY979_00885 [Candidatus Magasanikbacteria bacterium]|nr:hypothetical protein [Candidatus Magasanikbacteria bacterium]